MAIVPLLLRVGFYAALCILGLAFFGSLLSGVSTLVAATLGTFLAGVAANAFTVRIFEGGRTLTSVGLQWTSGSLRNVLYGLAGGMGAAMVVLLGPLLIGAAQLGPDGEQPASLSALIFTSVALLFGASGEELLFRGYAFQLLVRRLGPFATILPVAVLFALSHMNNLSISWLGFVNTAAFGVVFGVAYLRTRDLWFPIGMHFGWNWVLPLLGVNLSGFRMGVTGVAMQWKAGELWSGGAYGPEASLLTSAVVVALLYYTLWVPVYVSEPELPGREG